jgi:hypothetical protein
MHPSDGNTYAINQHLASLDDEEGQEDGKTCGRVEEPDEDWPRGYRPTPCNGVMVHDDGIITCDYCGESV